VSYKPVKCTGMYLLFDYTRTLCHPSFMLVEMVSNENYWYLVVPCCLKLYEIFFNMNSIMTPCFRFFLDNLNEWLCPWLPSLFSNVTPICLLCFVNFFLYISITIFCWCFVCNQCLSPLMLWVRGVLDTTLSLCDKVCQWLATGLWFSSGTQYNIPPWVKKYNHDNFLI
jgi:hypothetical protein